ncbi:TetR/AcrR family transcriptional regulator [Mycolicibacterium sp.]|uniref:TetR/AcrR family transcriptional regulator n=1 Tax=Mycolicibacterium sp. TaxID=2320850 RepID=UPI00355D03F3
MPRGDDETYRRIKAAAVQLFAQQGYVATGIRTIAREAGFSTTALYVYVSNKEALLTDIIRQGFETLIGSARSELADVRNPSARLAALVRQHVRFEADHQMLANVITIEYQFLSEEARLKVRPLRDTYENIWSEVIEEGVQSGAFAAANSGLTRRALLEMCSAPESWYRADGRLSVEDIGDIFSDMALNLVKAKRPTRPRGSK